MWGFNSGAAERRSTAALVTEYAAAFDAAVPADADVRSPLGAWLLLALLAPASQGETRRTLEALLGVSAEEAAKRAQELVRQAHREVGLAIGLWGTRELCTDAFFAWLKDVGTGASTGEVPSQATLDAWAQEATHGLITKFPLERTPLTAIILASALATKIQWSDPFDVASGQTLGGTFGGQVRHALRSGRSHPQTLQDTQAAGRVAVHEVHSERGLFVVSVIAEPERPQAHVLRAAYEVVAAQHEGQPRARPVSLFDVPLGEGHAWTLSERRRASEFGDKRVQEFHATMPSWRLDALLNLASAPGVGAAFEAMRPFIRPDAPQPVVFEAAQAATARFSRFGFEAAAVTAFGVLAGAGVPKRKPGTIVTRVAEVRFNRPYAVVAFTRSFEFNGAGSAWDAVPVFSAWVSKPEELLEADLVPAAPPNPAW